MRVFRLQRIVSSSESTLGLLFDGGKFSCFTLEDQEQTVKVYGETRIPAGEYELALRKVGGHHQRYLKRYPHIHRGMIWLKDVPGFQFVLLHVGNTDDDTAGCVLVGDSAQRVDEEGNTRLLWSRAAYMRVYPQIADAIEGEGARLRVLDPPGSR